MDYDTFDKILKKNGIEDEPAFEKVFVDISPLPPMNGNPLGLYYSESDINLGILPGTIVVPPEADEQTVLHELGHRYGHYYTGDLSEEFAESYRNGYHRPVRMEATPPDHTIRNIAIVAGLYLLTMIACQYKK
jgi:hypothetical protein